MFGKPEWFRDKTFGWGLAPIVWQGWVYCCVWMSLLILPFLILLARRQPIEAGIWLTLSIVALFYDILQIKRARQTVPELQTTKKNDSAILYIDDATSSLTTKNYDMNMRQK